MGLRGDITGKPVEAKQRRHRARPRQAEERFRRFAENSSDVFWILDVTRQRLEYLSPAFEQTWGRPTRAAIADPEVWNRSIHLEDRGARAQALERVVARAEPLTHEYRIERPDGAVRWIRETSFPIRDAHGRLTQIGGIAHDTSSREPLNVYVVEADPIARETKTGALRRGGQRVTSFASEAAFLDVAGSLGPGCAVVRVDDASPAPFAAARALKARRDDLPVVFEATLGGDVGLAVRAMKAGAADVLAAPADTASLLTAVASALAEVRETGREERAAETARGQIALMSQREREVLEGLLLGGTNKSIARELGISPRTVEIHRARVMERLGVHTAPEAVLAAASAGMKPGRASVADLGQRARPSAGAGRRT